MAKNRGIKIVVIVGLCLAIGLLTVAYAFLSQNLNITGTARTTDSSAWNIYLTNISCTSTGDAASGTVSVENQTTINLSGITLTAPGESVTCTFDVVNGGEIDAKLSAVTSLTPAIEGIGSTATSDVTIVSNNYSSTLSYNTNVALIPGCDTLNANETVKMKMVVSYNANATSVPSNDVLINNLGFELTYAQANSVSEPSGGC